MTEVLHIASPLSAPWCGWVLLGLFLCAVLSEFLQPGIITQAHTALTAQVERTYKNAPMNLYAQILITLFRLGTLALGLCICHYAGGAFLFASYAAVFGCVLGLLLVKMLCNIWLDYTFSLSRRYMPLYEQYGDLATLVTCFLYLGLLVTLWIGDLQISLWVLGGSATLFVLTCLYRIARHYIQSPKAILYVALYICTLEVLPLAGLYLISSKMIASI